jgi:hypothetical protein
MGWVMSDVGVSQVASQAFSAGSVTDPNSMSFNLADKAGTGNPQSIHQFNSDLGRYTEIERLNNNVFFYNANKLNFDKIDFGNIGETVINLVKKTRQKFDDNIAELVEPPPADGFSVQELFKKQVSGYITNLEFETVSKIVSKSVENIYILLRQ